MHRRKFIFIFLLFLLLISCITTKSSYPNNSSGQNVEDLGETSEMPQNTTEASNDNSLAPMSEKRLLQLASEKVPWNFQAVRKDQTILSIVHDLDKNGYDDVLVTVFEGDDKDENQFSELSKTTRLFNSDERNYSYYLLIFYQYSGELILRYTVPVSEQLVFTGITPFEVKEGSDFPYALLFSFRNHSGIDQELVILSGFGITKFNFKENLSEITIVQDIDDDGFIDIIVHEQGFEEGTGFETFITWYKWNKRQYIKYKTTNVVRNLREFFQTSAEYLRDGNFSEFLEFAVDPESLLKVKKQGLSDSDIMNLIFKPSKNITIENDYFNGDTFSAVVFPEIMETPFSYEKRNNLHHQVSLRFNRIGETGIVFFAELKMNKNPFEKRQFCFSLEE